MVKTIIFDHVIPSSPLKLIPMKKIALYAFAIPLLFAACKSKCVEDSGIHLSRELSVKPYDEIKVSGPVKLLLRQDSSYKISISADSNVLELVKAEVSGHELTLKLDPERYCGTDSIVVTAGIGDLRKLKISEAVKVSTTSKINLNDLTVEMSGATALRLDVNTGKLTLNNDGVASVNLVGQAGVNQLKSKGAIDLQAFDFVTGVYDIDIEGAGKSNINVLNDLKVKTTGATEIYYKGNPKNVEEKKSGVAKLQKVN